MGVLQTASIGIDEEVVLAGDIFRPGDSTLHGDVTAVDSEIACVNCHRIVAVGSIVGGQHIVVRPHRLIRIGAAVADGAQIAGIHQAFHRTTESRVIFSISLAGIIDSDGHRLLSDGQRAEVFGECVVAFDGRAVPNEGVGIGAGANGGLAARHREGRRLLVATRRGDETADAACGRQRRAVIILVSRASGNSQCSRCHRQCTAHCSHHIATHSSRCTGGYGNTIHHANHVGCCTYMGNSASICHHHVEDVVVA